MSEFFSDFGMSKYANRLEILVAGTDFGVPGGPDLLSFRRKHVIYNVWSQFQNPLSFVVFLSLHEVSGKSFWRGMTSIPSS